MKTSIELPECVKMKHRIQEQILAETAHMTSAERRKHQLDVINADPIPRPHLSPGHRRRPRHHPGPAPRPRRRGTSTLRNNAATGEYEDLMKAGVIDPTKVTRSALQNAASIAGLLLTTEVLIADMPETDKPAMAGAGGGMGGGMDGMY
jgi:hypothetical protein